MLAEILREWFGPDAGQPGTRFQVAFETAGDSLNMQPVGFDSKTSTAENWRHYMREEIPPLFGLDFNQALWNQGFVIAGKHMFLLVTLEKGSLNQQHRYEDRFLTEELFQWQSQNKTKQDGKHGRLIHDHRVEGVDVHLFVRRHKLLDGKAAPFVYCGIVSFESWKGNSPITVQWRLSKPVPPALLQILNVPGST